MEAPRLTAANVLKMVEGVMNWRTLRFWLNIPESIVAGIEQCHSDDRRRLEALIIHWLEVDPFPTWRRVINALDRIEEYQTADSIRQYAEPLTDLTLTLRAVTTAVAQVGNWNWLGRCLGVPLPKLNEIDHQYPTDKKKMEATIIYWLHYRPVASWGTLAGKLYYMKEKQSLQIVQRYLKKTIEPTLTLPNLCQALAEVEDLNHLGVILCVRWSKREKIRDKYSDSAEAKRQMLRHFLTSHPVPSWQVVFEGLYVVGRQDVKYHTILQDIRRRYGRGLPFSDPFLPILDCKELDKRRSDTPLTVHFPHHPQYGMFSTLITFLLSSGNRYPSPWMIQYTDGSPTCLYQNCVKLTIPKCAGSVTLIDSLFGFFEAHVSAPGPRLRSFIQTAIFTGAAAILKCEKNPAIVCPCKVGDAHVATVKTDQGLWICKKNPEKWDKLRQSDKEWFESTGPQQPSPSKERIDEAMKSGYIVDILSNSDLVDIKCYLVDMEVNQIYNLGLVLGLHQPNVKKMKDSDTFLDDVLAAWLCREDDVEKRGLPSWKTLVGALKHQLLGRTGITDDICRDKGI